MPHLLPLIADKQRVLFVRIATATAAAPSLGMGTTADADATTAATPVGSSGTALGSASAAAAAVAQEELRRLAVCWVCGAGGGRPLAGEGQLDRLTGHQRHLWGRAGPRTPVQNLGLRG